MDMYGSGNPISNNDLSPTGTDGTDFGNALDGIETVTNTFVVTNMVKQV